MLSQSCLTLCEPMDYSHQATLSMGFSLKNTGVGCHALLQGIFHGYLPNPGIEPDPGIELSSLMSPALTDRFFTTSTT